jgi:glycosyltransferase involved in cell wall biosynthesis
MFRSREGMNRMRIAIVGPSPVPFCRGGIESFMAGLYRAINDLTPHTAELIKIPVRENSAVQVIKAYYTFYKTRLDHFDLVISTKYPAWNLRHRNHIIYLGHRLRGLYDTYPVAPENDKLYKAWPCQFPGPWMKRLVHWLDNRAIRPETIAHAFCTSKTIASRRGYFHPELPPSVVYHSTIHENYYRKPGRYLFTVNRLDPPKRVDLMIRAFKMVPQDIPFLIAGTGPHERYLRSLAGTDSRIRFLGDVSEDELTDLYAESLAVLYTPYAEDYGLITVEAMKSGKPVITTDDAGGPLEFVTQGVTGWIAEPSPANLARCIGDAIGNPGMLETMGNAARNTVANITWQNTVKQLLEPYTFWPEPGAKKPDERRRVLILVSYPVYPPRSGGQKRVAGLAEQLAKVYDVFLLALGRFNTPAENLEIMPWLHEIRVPTAPAHANAQWSLEKTIGETVSDVALDHLLPMTPNYIRALRHFEACSDIIISEQPYMHRHIKPDSRTQLIIHSSQNFEYTLKKNLLSRTRKGRFLLDRVRSAEAAAVTQSDILFATCRRECSILVDSYDRRADRLSAVLPNGVDTQLVKPPDGDDRKNARTAFAIDPDRMVCLFIGAWHPPNLEAFHFIRETVAPNFPDALFLIVGSIRDHYVNQGGDLSQLQANIHVTGDISEEDKNMALAAADIALNPMMSGSGTNLKILEYAAAGLPVVSTPHGIRGLSFESGKDVCIAEPADFVDTLRSLMSDPVTRRKMAGEARRTVTVHYEWRKIGSQMIETIESALPLSGPGRTDMRSADVFLAGWHYPEKWEKTGSDSGWVRWTSGRSETRIPSPRRRGIVHIILQGGRENQELSIHIDGASVFEGVIGTSWRAIDIPISPVPGCDERRLMIESSSWSPSENGSADSRILGVAVSEIHLLENN